MKKGLTYTLTLLCGLWAVSANAAPLEKRAEKPFADADHVVYSLPNGNKLPLKATVNLLGGAISHPKVVFIFWGPSFNNAASPDYSYARTLQAYRNQLGSTACWAVLQHYGVSPTNLGAGTPDWFDTSTPPTNVTDATVQSEVNRYLSSHTYDASTIYEVVTPKTSYSSSGTSTSCGGPSLAYCYYHSNYSFAGRSVIYTVQPYESCSGCKVSGWTDAQNEEHFVFHATAEAATGVECMDKCSWSPTPFLSGGYGYQYVESINNCTCTP